MGVPLGGPSRARCPSHAEGFFSDSRGNFPYIFEILVKIREIFEPISEIVRKIRGVSNPILRIAFKIRRVLKEIRGVFVPILHVLRKTPHLLMRV